MKNVLKTKTVSILLVLISIDGIYSGCCCKKKPSNNDSKANSTGSQGKPDTGKPDTTELEPKAITALEKYINTKSGNRVGLKGVWKVKNLSDRSYIITFGLFKATIAKGEIGKLTNLKDIAQIENIECMMQMARDNKTDFVFNNGGKCKLGDLVKSLNLLSVDCRNNNTDEYLKVEDLNGKFLVYCYLNLNNGLMYKESRSRMIGRASKRIQNDAFVNLENPVYHKNKYYNGEVEWNKKDGDPKVKYNEAIFESGDIKNFNFELKTE